MQLSAICLVKVPRKLQKFAILTNGGVGGQQGPKGKSLPRGLKRVKNAQNGLKRTIKVGEGIGRSKLVQKMLT